MPQSLSKKIVVNLLFNTVITVAVFYLLFRLSVIVVSIFHQWESSLQRGIFWGKLSLFVCRGSIVAQSDIFILSIKGNESKNVIQWYRSFCNGSSFF